jgi:PAS domain S-box-containing protein
MTKKPSYVELKQRVAELEKQAVEQKCREMALRESKELFEKTFKSQKDAIFILNADVPPKITDCNPAAEKVFGYTRQELPGRTTEFLHISRAALEDFQKQLYPSIAKQGFFHLNDFMMKRKDGTLFPTEHTVVPLNNEKAERTGWVSVVRDITGWKQMQEAMRESEERYRLLAENVSDVIFIRDMNLRFTYISPSVEKLTGYSVEEAMALTMAEAYTPHSIELAMEAFSEELSREKDEQSDPSRVCTIEMEGYRKDGSTIWTEAKMRFLRDSNGHPAGILGVSRDITERKQAEIGIRISEERYRSLVEDMPALVCRFYPDGILTFVNSKYCSYFHKRKLELVGSDFFQFIPEQDRQKVKKQFLSLSKEKAIVTYEHRVISPNGSIQWQQWTGRALFGEAAEVEEFQSVGMDITERKEVENRLLESEARMRALLDALTESVMLVDAEGTILVINDTAARRLGKGVGESIGLRMNEYLPEDVAALRKTLGDKVLLSGKGRRFQDQWQGKYFDNSIAPIFDENGKAKELVIFAQDITEEKHLMEALRASEEHYRLVFEKGATGIVIAQSDGTIIEANEVVAKIGGYTNEELERMSLSDLCADPHDCTRLIDALRKEGSVRDWETALKRKDGTVYTALLNVEVVELGGTKALFTSLCDITPLREAEKALKSREKQLEIKTKNLEEANTALRVLLNSREQDKLELEKKVVINVRRLIEPYLTKLKSSGLDERQATYLEILESNLKDIVSPFAAKLSSEYLGLTPKELQVASLVKEGKTTKEIAELLNSSVSAIRFHRENVRKKIGLRNQKANLRSRLLSLK